MRPGRGRSLWAFDELKPDEPDFGLAFAAATAGAEIADRAAAGDAGAGDTAVGPGFAITTPWTIRAHTR
jgi:hypothetical protein